MVDKIVEERKTAMDKNEVKGLPNDAIDALLRDSGESDGMQQHRLPLDFISGNIIEMMIPGEETVPTAMTLAVKFLVDNPAALAHLVVRIFFYWISRFDGNQKLYAFLCLKISLANNFKNI